MKKNSFFRTIIFLNGYHSIVTMSSNKTRLFLFLVFGVILAGVVSACYCGDGTCEGAENSINCPEDCECVPQSYDSCYLCLNTGIDPSNKLSNYITQISGDAWYYETSTNTVCGNGFYYVS